MNISYRLEEIDFEWDSDKADTNLLKHDVSFTEAPEVFLDPFVYPVDARDVEEEARDAVIGLTRKWRLLYMAYVWRKLTLRLISARKATKTERKLYENQ
jgi:hypothetical protein